MFRFSAFFAALPILITTASAGTAQAAPFPNPTSSNQLACNLSPTQSPADYRTWWTRIVTNTTYQAWLWNQILPSPGTICRGEAADTFWERAVPENWDSIANIGGWHQGTGGYFRQTLWLRAIPDEWVPVSNIGGWHEPTGGYYAQ